MAVMSRNCSPSLRENLRVFIFVFWTLFIVVNVGAPPSRILSFRCVPSDWQREPRWFLESLANVIFFFFSFLMRDSPRLATPLSGAAHTRSPSPCPDPCQASQETSLVVFLFFFLFFPLLLRPMYDLSFSWSALASAMHHHRGLRDMDLTR
ncbi:hypothetical protein F5Y17DRAFT_338095 [Xylariaceae sp. FL0594]|nr:hypothetical protein F5Y17DRAFT_338095 [Xylariaceae sp. FL0594]